MTTKTVTKCPHCGKDVEHRNETVTKWALLGWLPPCDECFTMRRKPEPVGQMVGELHY